MAGKKPKERLPSVKVDVTVSANDVVAIKVAEFERYLMDEERSLVAKLKDLGLEAKSLKGDLELSGIGIATPNDLAAGYYIETVEGLKRDLRI